MTDVQQPQPAHETYRVHDVLEDDEREPTKDFKHYMESNEEEDQQPTPMAVFTPPPMTLSDTPAQEALSASQIKALSLEIVDTITVIEDKGVQTTTVEIGKGRFKGSSLKIALYDTHPTSYNIELTGAPDAMLQFHQGLPTLHSLLSAALPEHVFQLQSSLSDHHQSDLKKREKARVQKSKSSR